MNKAKRPEINYKALRKVGFFGHPVILDIMVFLLSNASEGKVTTSLGQIQTATLSYHIETIHDVIVEMLALGHITFNEEVLVVSTNGELQEGFSINIPNFKTFIKQ